MENKQNDVRWKGKENLFIEEIDFSFFWRSKWSQFITKLFLFSLWEKNKEKQQLFWHSKAKIASQGVITLCFTVVISKCNT